MKDFTRFQGFFLMRFASDMYGHKFEPIMVFLVSFNAEFNCHHYVVFWLFFLYSRWFVNCGRICLGVETDSRISDYTGNFLGQYPVSGAGKSSSGIRPDTGYRIFCIH